MAGSRPGRWLALLAAPVVLLAGAAVAAAVVTAPAKPGITVRSAPAGQSVTQGDPARYTISVTSTGGFAGTVGLTAGGLPRGAAASFAPSSFTLSSGATAASTLTLTTTSIPVGSYSFTVTATGGKVTGSVGVQVTVNARLSGSLAMTATPSSVATAPGTTVAYAVQLTRTNLPAPVTLSLVGALPAGFTARFTPNPVTGTSATLQVTTAATTNDGSYQLYLVASGVDPGGQTRYAYANVQLVVQSPHQAFTISGSPTGTLAPGLSRPIDLLLGNPNARPLSVTNLIVTVQSVTRTSYAVAHNLACGPVDYSVRPYSGGYPLTVPARSAVTLSGLGVAPSAQPAVMMLDRPVNQDGCKGATVTLAYTGAGQGS